jgi:hypothetical protein
MAVALPPELPPAAALCMVNAANYYRVPLDALRAIARVERGTPGQVHENKDKQGKVVSVDIGRMQINSSGLPELKQYGITQESLLSNDCQNIYVGAWIFEKKLKLTPDLWTGIGAYNSMTPGKNMDYQRAVWRELKGLWGQRRED